MANLPDNKFGISGELKDFSQAQYEQYQPAVLRATRDSFFDFGSGNGALSAEAVVRGVVCRSAVEAGILVGVNVEDIGKMRPPAVRWLAARIQEHVKAVTDPEPDPN